MTWNINTDGFGGFWYLTRLPPLSVAVGARPPPLPDHPLIRAPIPVVTDYPLQQALTSPGGRYARLWGGNPPNVYPVDVPEACLQVRPQIPSPLAPPSDDRPSIVAPYPVPTDETPELQAWAATQGNALTQLWRGPRGGPFTRVWVPTPCLRIQPQIEIP